MPPRYRPGSQARAVIRSPGVILSPADRARAAQLRDQRAAELLIAEELFRQRRRELEARVLKPKRSPDQIMDSQAFRRGDYTGMGRRITHVKKKTSHKKK
jgi:hypothetical protein